MSLEYLLTGLVLAGIVAGLFIQARKTFLAPMMKAGRRSRLKLLGVGMLWPALLTLFAYVLELAGFGGHGMGDIFAILLFAAAVIAPIVMLLFGEGMVALGMVLGFIVSYFFIFS